MTGDGFEFGGRQGTRGIPATPTLAFDQTDVLYLARSGGRYWEDGDADDRFALYRIPVGARGSAA